MPAVAPAVSEPLHDAAEASVVVHVEPRQQTPAGCAHGLGAQVLLAPRQLRVETPVQVVCVSITQ